MQIAAASNLVCPIDGSELARRGAALVCGRGHSFDVAREGHCNLLLVQHKASRDPGDSKAMVAARRRFLDAGYFAPIAERLFADVRALAANLPEARECTLLDAGCGEGYYLDRLCRLATQCPDPLPLRLAGIDVSKWAVQAAARRKLPVAWLVASNALPPFSAGSVDLILCLFGFPAWHGFKKVQQAGACVVLVDPGPDHLLELRQIIYPSVTRSEPPSLAKAEAAGYGLEREDVLRFPIALDSTARIQDLLAMTPHAHRLPAAGRAALARLERLDVTVEVVVRVLRLG